MLSILFIIILYGIWEGSCFNVHGAIYHGKYNPVLTKANRKLIGPGYIVINGQAIFKISGSFLFKYYFSNGGGLVFRFSDTAEVIDRAFKTALVLDDNPLDRRFRKNLIKLLKDFLKYYKTVDVESDDIYLCFSLEKYLEIHRFSGIPFRSFLDNLFPQYKQDVFYFRNDPRTFNGTSRNMAANKTLRIELLTKKITELRKT